MTQHEPAAHMPPPPETLSAEARAQMEAMASAALPDGLDANNLDMAVMRQFADGMQTLLGAKRRKAHAVTIAQGIIAGGPADGKRVFLNVHGGGFATDSGSLTENIPIAATTA